MGLNGYEMSQIYVGVPLVLIGVVTILVFDSPLPAYFICLAVVFWFIAYITREAFDKGEETRKPRWYGDNVGGSEVTLEYSRYNSDRKYVDVLVDSRKVVRMFPGNRVTLRCDPSSEIYMKPDAYEGLTLSLRESQTGCYLYLRDLYLHVDDDSSVEPRLKERFDEDKRAIRRKLPYMYAAQAVSLFIILLYMSKCLRNKSVRSPSSDKIS